MHDSVSAYTFIFFHQTKVLYEHNVPVSVLKLET